MEAEEPGPFTLFAGLGPALLETSNTHVLFTILHSPQILVFKVTLSGVFCDLEPKNPEQGLQHNDGQASSSCLTGSVDGAQGSADKVSMETCPCGTFSLRSRRPLRGLEWIFQMGETRLPSALLYSTVCVPQMERAEDPACCVPRPLGRLLSSPLLLHLRIEAVLCIDKTREGLAGARKVNTSN